MVMRHKNWNDRLFLTAAGAWRPGCAVPPTYAARARRTALNSWQGADAWYTDECFAVSVKDLLLLFAAGAAALAARVARLELAEASAFFAPSRRSRAAAGTGIFVAELLATRADPAVRRRAARCVRARRSGSGEPRRAGSDQARRRSPKSSRGSR
jgi:hypothetical protein